MITKGVGACGLNLQRANHLIILDPDWNPETDLQCLSRIYCMGQIRKTFISILLTDGTVDIDVEHKQDTKLLLQTAFIDSHYRRILPPDLGYSDTAKQSTWREVLHPTPYIHSPFDDFDPTTELLESRFHIIATMTSKDDNQVSLNFTSSPYNLIRIIAE